MEKLKYKEITDIILKSFYEVYNELGAGFLESVYENALEIVLTGYGLNTEKQKVLSVYFRDTIVGDFRTDLIVNEKIIIELKAVSNILAVHDAQLINYLKATKIEVGLLLNFGNKPEFKRFAFDNYRKNLRISAKIRG